MPDLISARARPYISTCHTLYQHVSGAVLNSYSSYIYMYCMSITEYIYIYVLYIYVCLYVMSVYMYMCAYISDVYVYVCSVCVY